MGEPAVAAKPQSVYARVDPKLTAQLVKNLKKVTEESIAASHKLSVIEPGLSSSIQKGLIAGNKKLELIAKLLDAKDPNEEFKKLKAKEGELFAWTAVSDVGKLSLEVLETTLKSNVDMAIVIAEHKGMTESLKSLRAVSEKIGYIGKAAGVFGVISDGIKLVDAVQKNDTAKALQASANIIEGIGNLIGGGAPLGMALAAPVKMILVAGQLGGILKGIRLNAERERVMRLINDGDLVFKRAKTTYTYAGVYQAYRTNPQMLPEDIQAQAQIAFEAGTALSARLINLINAIETLEAKRREEGRKRIFSPYLLTSVNLMTHRGRGHSRLILEGKSLVQKVLDGASELLVTRLLEAEAISFTRFPLVLAKVKSTWLI